MVKIYHCNEYLYLVANKFLPPIFKKLSSLFPQQQKYENLIIENEAELYAYLKDYFKDMQKQYPEMSTPLQELITFSLKRHLHQLRKVKTFIRSIVYFPSADNIKCKLSSTSNW